MLMGWEGGGVKINNIYITIWYLIDAEGRTYLFDLDFNMGSNNPYTVDAAFYGNVSHFINHR